MSGERWFKGSLRMPKAVAYDRETLEDWVTCEARNILEEGNTQDAATALRWARARMEGSPALLRALVPELGRADPKPIRRRLALGFALEPAGWAGLFYGGAAGGSPVAAFIGAGVLVVSRLLLLQAGEGVLRLRNQYHDGWMGMLAALGLLGYAGYHFLYYMPRRDAERRELTPERKTPGKS